MARVVLFGASVMLASLFAYQANLVAVRLSGPFIVPVNYFKVGLSVSLQLAALAFVAWYIRLLAPRERHVLSEPRRTAQRLKLLPLVAVVPVLVFSVMLLEVGLLCGDQSLLTRQRSGDICPK